MSFTVKKAIKEQRRARVFLYGPSGSGKTWTALTWAQVLGKRIGLIDTEHESALVYAADFDFEHVAFDPPYTTDRYIAAMRAVVDAGCDVMVIDSLTHAWSGKGGLLEQVDEYGRSHRGDTFGGWRDATPQHTNLVEALTSQPIHVISTARAKTQHDYQKNEKGKLEVVKLGLAPIQREGLEYEHDVVGELTVPDNWLHITKTRCSMLTGFSQEKPDAKAAGILADWLGSGTPLPTPDELAGKALADDATTEQVRALYAQATRYGLLPLVVHDRDGEDHKLGDLLVTRGRELGLGVAS